MVRTDTIIRPRREDDLSACVRVLAKVHAADAYPLHWPADPRDWLSPKGLCTAWVAQRSGTVVGHIGLRTVGDHQDASLWCSATHVPPDQMAEVTALFVSPDARGTGLGASLLVKASSEARSRGLLPVVQVLDNNRAAMAMYQRMGWQLVGKAVAPWARSNNDTRFLHFYVLPA